MNRIKNVLEHKGIKQTWLEEQTGKSSELVLVLGNATQEIIDTVITEKPVKVLAIDKLFEGNDQLKTNTVLQIKDAGIEFKTI